MAKINTNSEDTDISSVSISYEHFFIRSEAEFISQQKELFHHVNKYG